MIIHKLIRHHLRHGDDDAFYNLQAIEAVRWMQRNGVPMGPKTRVLDLGCGHGLFGMQFVKRGCLVTFSDHHHSLRPGLTGTYFRILKVGEEPLSKLGQFDLVLCSNLIEHLPNSEAFVDEIPSVLTYGGVMFLSWTNWWSPWGGHDFSPWHYFGTKLGPNIYDRIHGPGKRGHFPYAGLWPTHIGTVLRQIRRQPELKIVAVAPRYYTEHAWIMRIPILREFLAWNCAILIQRIP